MCIGCSQALLDLCPFTAQPNMEWDTEGGIVEVKLASDRLRLADQDVGERQYNSALGILPSKFGGCYLHHLALHYGVDLGFRKVISM